MESGPSAQTLGILAVTNHPPIYIGFALRRCQLVALAEHLNFERSKYQTLLPAVCMYNSIWQTFYEHVFAKTAAFHVSKNLFSLYELLIYQCHCKNVL